MGFREHGFSDRNPAQEGKSSKFLKEDQMKEGDKEKPIKLKGFTYSRCSQEWSWQQMLANIFLHASGPLTAASAD